MLGYKYVAMLQILYFGILCTIAISLVNVFFSSFSQLLDYNYFSVGDFNASISIMSACECPQLLACLGLSLCVIDLATFTATFFFLKSDST